MKSGNLVVALAGFVVVSGIAYAFASDKATPAAVSTSATVAEPCCSTGEGTPACVNDATSCEPKSGEAVHVDDLAAKPENYKGEIVLKAAVARVTKSKDVFAAIDYREFKKCHELDCAKHYLPVKFSGEIPKPETLVQTTGQVVKGEKGLVFEAKKLEVIK